MVAARCAATPGVEVVLIEAGPDRARALPANTLPIGPDSTLIDPIGIHIHAGADGSASADGVVTRGRVLGGSGAVNGGYFIRGRLTDYTRWPGPEWSAEVVGAAFRRIEHDLDFPGDPRHGDAGPIPVRRARADRYAPPTRAAVTAFAGAGLAALADLNDMHVEVGFGPVPGNIRAEYRIDTATGYFGNGTEDIRVPEAIRLRTGTTVLSIRIDHGRARGVRLRTAAGAIEEVAADLVVLAAGAVRTPQLLLLSGVGPAAEVARIGADPVVDLPGVGRGIRDHPELMLPTDELAVDHADRLLEVVAHLDGVEVRPYAAGFGAFIPGVDDRRRHVGIALMRSDTVGTLHLDAADPSAAPRVDYDLRGDRDRLAAIGRRETAIGDLAARLGASEGAGGRIGMSLHASCGARMGDDDDPGAVVDSRCRVRGVDGLRVIDTSAFPEIPTRGPHATAIMFADRACDLLLEDVHGESATVD